MQHSGYVNQSAGRVKKPTYGTPLDLIVDELEREMDREMVALYLCDRDTISNRLSPHDALLVSTTTNWRQRRRRAYLGATFDIFIVPFSLLRHQICVERNAEAARLVHSSKRLRGDIAQHKDLERSAGSVLKDIAAANRVGDMSVLRIVDLVDVAERATESTFYCALLTVAAINVADLWMQQRGVTDLALPSLLKRFQAAAPEKLIALFMRVLDNTVPPRERAPILRQILNDHFNAPSGNFELASAKWPVRSIGQESSAQ